MINTLNDTYKSLQYHDNWFSCVIKKHFGEVGYKKEQYCFLHAEASGIHFNVRVFIAK